MLLSFFVLNSDSKKELVSVLWSVVLKFLFNSLFSIANICIISMETTRVQLLQWTTNGEGEGTFKLSYLATPGIWFFQIPELLKTQTTLTVHDSVKEKVTVHVCSAARLYFVTFWELKYSSSCFALWGYTFSKKNIHSLRRYILLIKHESPKRKTRWILLTLYIALLGSHALRTKNIRCILRSMAFTLLERGIFLIILMI